MMSQYGVEPDLIIVKNVTFCGIVDPFCSGKRLRGYKFSNIFAYYLDVS